MNLLAGLQTFIYVVSSALFYPVLIGLVFLIFWVTLILGSFLREYVERRQGLASALKDYEERLQLAATGDIHDIDIRLERLLQEAELGLLKSLDKVRFVIRVGPALGLMGTLIPMGVALSALAQGDMPKMAGSMVTAFTTTVVGLACGIVAYLITMVREKWVRADMREMEYMTELMLRERKSEKEEFYQASKRANECGYDKEI